jgi:CheY-like chemotaxis protein
VLVVDDDDDVRRVLVEFLETLGFNVEEAADGVSGLAALERSPPDVVILDFAMPGLNGAEVASRARKSRPDLRIVFATGYAESEALEAVRMNATVLRKPFGLDELQRAVAAAVAGL